MTVRRLTDRLWVKLMGVFVIVIAVGVTVTVTLARQGTASRFEHFMLGSRMLQPDVLQQLLQDYYREEGGWQGLDGAIRQLVRGAAPMEMGGGMMGGGMMGGGIMAGMGGAMAAFDGRVRVVDTSGRIVADNSGPTGGSLPLGGAERGWPLTLDGQQIGTLLIDSPLMALPPTAAQSLLGGVTQAVLIAALAAALVAVALGALLVRQITRPLTALSYSSARIAAGDFSARVAVGSRDEVGQVARAFNQMAAALETQEQLRTNLVADIAHELRTPLSGIQGSVEALQDGVFPLTPESLEPIHAQALLLSRLVEDLRTAAQADAGQIRLDRHSLRLEEVAARQVAVQLPSAQEAGVTLALLVEDELPEAWGDPQRLEQVIGNLISNALRYTPAGGCVEVRLAPAGGGVSLAVIDSGEGIGPEDLPYVFDRFYRSDRSRDRKTGGSGLGLAIARQLVEAHGGRIRAESPPAGRRQGSAFWLWLPTATGDEERV